LKGKGRSSSPLKREWLRFPEPFLAAKEVPAQLAFFVWWCRSKRLRPLTVPHGLCRSKGGLFDLNRVLLV